MKGRRIVVDLDGVLFEEGVDWTDFAQRAPITERINRVKELSKENTIIVYTARKAEEAFWLTVSQLAAVGLDRHVACIVFDKPIGDVYVDDKFIPLEDF